MLWFAKRRRILEPNSAIHIHTSDKPDRTLSDDFDINIKMLSEPFDGAKDYIVRYLECLGNRRSAVIYISSLADPSDISEMIVKPLLTAPDDIVDDEHPAESIMHKAMYHADGSMETDYRTILDMLLRGRAVVLIEGLSSAFVINVQKIEKRSVDQPKSEQVIRGPRDGFIENMQTNAALIRARIPSEELKFKTLEIGSRTKSTVAIIYMNGIVDPELVQEVEARIRAIQTDRILDAGYIEQYIQDHPRSPFPQLRNTERPDVVAGNLLEGRVAVMVDGSPYALICPTTFAMFYQTSEDYNERAGIMSLLRVIRLISLLFSLLIPSLYIAVLSFHPELIPTKFAVAVASGRSGVPFPTSMEILIMEVAVEILREATVRMPQQIGGALSIVGVLVIGQAAVMAGFVSPITVVVIALTTISSFATPAYNTAMAFRMLRFPILIAAGFFGFFGLIISLFIITNHLLSMRSFGVPFISPLSPFNLKGFLDSIIRAPLRWMTSRPDEIHPRDRRRLASSAVHSTENKGD